MKNFEIPHYYKNKSYLEYENNKKYNKYRVLYIIIRHLHKEVAYAKDNQIPLSYVKKFNLKKISFPLTFANLQKLIRQNKHIPIKINVFCDYNGAISNLGIISNKKNSRENIYIYYCLKQTRQITQ